jgi:arginyl-tRNA synthetase
VTYVGKDIAYQMWKLGLLGRDFHYVPFDWSPDREAYPLWATTASPGRSDHPPFGHGEIVYNVIDARQSYLQRVVHLGLVSLGHVEEAERSIHFSYEMVALTPAAVAALFPDYPLDEADKAKPYLEMSGRKGLGVRADDLVEALLQRARSEVRKRNADLPEDAIEETARRISIGALRYYMVRFSRNRVVAFDLDAALAFEGETGPYLQYSLVRARNILKKVSDPIPGSDAPESILARIDLAALPEDTLADHWNLALLLSREPSVLRQAVSSLELAGVAKHAYVLAQAFNSFYHRYPVSQESSEAVRMVRIALVKLYLDGMTHLLGRMGIEVPERM